MVKALFYWFIIIGIFLWKFTEYWIVIVALILAYDLHRDGKLNSSFYKSLINLGWLSEGKKKKENDKLLRFCEWSKCHKYEDDYYGSPCGIAMSGENCYSLYGHVTPDDFPDFTEKAFEELKFIKEFRNYEVYLDGWRKKHE